MLEPPAVVAGLHDVAVVGKPVEQCGGHLGVAKYLTPFPEAKVGGDQHAGSLVELGEQVEQQRSTSLAERQVAQLIQDHQVHVDQPVGQLSGLALALLQLQRVDQLHGREEAHPLAVPLDRLDPDGRGQVCLAGARTADEHHVVRSLDERAAVQRAHQCLVHTGLTELEAGEVTVSGEAGCTHLVRHGTHRTLGLFGPQQLTQEGFRSEVGVPCLRRHLGVVGGHAVQLQGLEGADDLLAHARAPSASSSPTERSRS